MLTSVGLDSGPNRNTIANIAPVIIKATMLHLEVDLNTFCNCNEVNIENGGVSNVKNIRCEH